MGEPSAPRSGTPWPTPLAPSFTAGRYTAPLPFKALMSSCQAHGERASPSQKMGVRHVVRQGTCWPAGYLLLHANLLRGPVRLLKQQVLLQQTAPQRVTTEPPPTACAPAELCLSCPHVLQLLVQVLQLAELLQSFPKQVVRADSLQGSGKQVLAGSVARMGDKGRVRSLRLTSRCL